MTAATRLLLIGVACCFLAAPTMRADTLIAQSCPIAVQPIEYIDNSCSFSSFDTNDGILVTVALQITGVSGSALPEQQNNSASTLGFTNSVATIEMYMTGPDGTVASVTDTSSGCNGSVAANSTNTSCTSTGFSGISGSAVLASDITQYEEVGSTFAIPVSAIGYLFSASGQGGFGSAGELFFGGTGSIGGLLVVTYDYTSPEPATPVLCGGSLLILAAFLRQRHLRKLAS
jgi:hypothetical protein